MNFDEKIVYEADDDELYDYSLRYAKTLEGKLDDVKNLVKATINLIESEAFEDKRNYYLADVFEKVNIVLSGICVPIEYLGEEMDGRRKERIQEQMKKKLESEKS